MTGGHTAPLSDADGDADVRDADAHESGNVPVAAGVGGEARAADVRAVRRAGGDDAGAAAWCTTTNTARGGVAGGTGKHGDARGDSHRRADGNVDVRVDARGRGTHRGRGREQVADGRDIRGRGHCRWKRLQWP